MRTPVSLLLALALLLAGAAAQSRHKVEGPFPAKSGETCVICYGVLDSTGLAYLVDGRRYTVDAGEAADFLADPDTRIRAFEAHLAQEGRSSQLVIGIGFAIVAVSIALAWLRRRKRG